MDNIAIRNYEEKDYPFVKSSWIKQQAMSNPFRSMRRGDFFLSYSPYLDKLIDTCVILIACNPEFPDQTYGYIAYNNNLLHFIYVKGLYRGFGLSKQLMTNAFPEVATHYTHLSGNVAFKRMARNLNLAYRPVFLRNI